MLEVPPGDGQLKDIPDIVLEDGDRLYVPARSSMVSVIGAVYNENSFVYKHGKRVSDYLAQAGGSTRDADSYATALDVAFDVTAHSRGEADNILWVEFCHGATCHRDRPTGDPCARAWSAGS